MSTNCDPTPDQKFTRKQISDFQVLTSYSQLLSSFLKIYNESMNIYTLKRLTGCNHFCPELKSPGHFTFVTMLLCYYVMNYVMIFSLQPTSGPAVGRGA